MSNNKMSDVFALPVKQDGRKAMVEADGSFLFASCKEDGEAAAHAINCHDDLYEALEALTEQYIDSFHDMGRCAPAIEHSQVIAAKAALAKARGES